MTKLTHLNDRGEARMVDVGKKPATERVATARGIIQMSREAFKAIESGSVAKGDVLATARIAGIMAAKRTADLIPLCHPIQITKAAVDITASSDLTGYLIEATVATTGATGVEMESLTAVSAACLTIYDMAKAIDKAMTISQITLLEKKGGKSGHWRQPNLSDDI